jgi:hypothetical protein
MGRGEEKKRRTNFGDTARDRSDEGERERKKK